jgi:hypothetical protein
LLKRREFKVRPRDATDVELPVGGPQPRAIGGAMKAVIGVILIVVGVIAFAWGGFAYKTRKKVLDVGPIHASRDVTHHVPLPPILGGLALVGGIVLLATGSKS